MIRSAWLQISFVLMLGHWADAYSQEMDASASLALVPWPQSVRRHEGRLELTARSRVVYSDPRARRLAEVVASDISRMTGLELARAEDAAQPGDIFLAIAAPPGKSGVPDGYRLKIDDSIAVIGESVQGLSFGTATLLQSLQIAGGRVTLPRVEIVDRPHFPYNAAMLDVARKPYSIETLRQCIDVCRFYKVRYLQLHLSDENAWTFPSLTFPALGSQNFAWAGGDKPSAYPVTALRKLVEYGNDRGVTLLPEIEMPGHSGQLRGTLPEIFGYRKADGTLASVGVINMTSDKALKAIDAIIGEACEIFDSSPYIHIGCDEASLGGLEEIPEVVAFLKDRQQTGVQAVFNEFVHKVHAMVAARGRQMIVWEGAPTAPRALPKDVVFMPWVGGSTAAAGFIREGHRVINAPWGVEKPYFDPYKVNGAQLVRGEPKLIGATSILWESTEDKAVPYLRFTGALRSEPTWWPDSGRTYEDFCKRIDATDFLLDRLLCGFTVETSGALPRASRKSLETAFLQAVELSTASSHSQPDIRYTLDGSDPTSDSPKWIGPVRLDSTTLLKARRFRAGQPEGNTLVRTLRKLTTVRHDAIGAVVSLSPDRPGYAGPGPQGLTDGRMADGNDFDQQGWVGWANDGRPIQITLDLGKPIDIRRLSAHTLRSAGGVFPPSKIEWHVSGDGKEFRPVGTVSLEQALPQRGWFTSELKETARFVRLTPTPSADWTFFDEIMVNGETDAATRRHAAFQRPVTLAIEPTAYVAPGRLGLTDGHVSQEPNFLSLEWLGFEWRGVDATIDLGEPRRLKSAGARFLQDARAGIWLPTEVEVLVSDDGTAFRSAGKLSRKSDQRPKAIELLSVEMNDIRARYVRVKAAAAGQWQFVDEVEVVALRPDSPTTD